LKLIKCRDINVNYLIDTEGKRQLDSVLNCCNLFSTIQFSTRNQNESSTAIDTIFTDTVAFSNFKIIPIIHLPLSPHFFAPLQLSNWKRLFTTRKILHLWTCVYSNVKCGCGGINVTKKIWKYVSMHISAVWALCRYLYHQC